MENWIKHFGFSKDVLSTKDHTFKMAGNEHILSELLYRIEASDIALLEGNKGYGKTYLLMQLAARYGGNRQVVYLDCKSLKKSVDIEKLLIGKYGFWNRIVKKMPKHMVVLLDNIQRLDHKNTEAIKYFFDQDNIQSVIFTAEDKKNILFSDSLIQRIGKRVITLQGLPEQDAVRLIKNRIGRDILTDANIKTIYHKGNGNIKDLLEDTRAVLRFMTDNEIDEISNAKIEELLYGKKEESETSEPWQEEASI